MSSAWSSSPRVQSSNTSIASGGSSQLVSDRLMTCLYISSGSSVMVAAILASISTETSASMASRSLGRSVTWDSVRLFGRPSCSPRASTNGDAATIRCSKPDVISHGLGCRPSNSTSSVSKPSRCFPPSILRASTRSSLEVRSLTRPISRRYIRTGSSRTSVVSVSGSHSGSSLSASIAASSGASAVLSPEDPSSHWASTPSAGNSRAAVAMAGASDKLSSPWLPFTPRIIS